MRGFLWHHYHEPELGQCRLHHCHTGIIDLLAHATFESYLASIRQVRRQDYRKIDGIEFRDTDDVEALDALHERTFLRQGIDRHPSESGLLRSIARAALEGGYGRLAGAFVGGAPASLILFLYDDRTAYYMFAANDPDHRGGSASTALLLRLIQDAHACGFAEVDLMGMNSPKRGDYKLSFNADVQGYVTVTCGV
jgi:CelD/BcsL family acetyltransferase involved in cellulose biosynthesis